MQILNAFTVLVLNFSLSIVSLACAITVCFILFIGCLKLITMLTIETQKSNNELGVQLFEHFNLNDESNQN